MTLRVAAELVRLKVPAVTTALYEPRSAAWAEEMLYVALVAVGRLVPPFRH